MKLKLKVTEICNANCSCCQQRLERYAEDHVYVMPFELACKCIDDAKRVGWKQLILSGGEPTLHPDLFEIIKYGKEQGMVVSLYTNGGMLTNEYIDGLCESGLDVLMLSYYSFDKSVFCSIRQSEELFDKATEALYRLKNREESEEFHIKVRLQSVLAKENYISLPDLLDFAIKAKFESMSVSYLEHAQTKPELYMDKDDIDDFKSTIVPLVKQILLKADISENSKKHNDDVIIDLFSDTYGEKTVDIARGEYRDDCSECVNKDKYIVINPEGNCLPCCGMEYYSERENFGNIKEKSLDKILQGAPMQKFWNSRKVMCKYCAVDRHFFFAID